MKENKGKIIFLEHYLLDHTDENHPITTEALLQVMTENGYSITRDTLHSDISILQQEGIPVEDKRIGNAKGYYISKRSFRLSELKALIDSVSSSQCIPERNSNTLIRQLAKMAPEWYRKDLTATAFCADRIKTNSPVAFPTLDTVSKAIKHEKKLSFQYIDYLPTKEEILRHHEKTYIVSPYALIWDDGRYYAASYDPEKEKIVPYRVDRMRNVTMSNEKADLSKPFKPADYCKKRLWMYDGDSEEQEVILFSDNRHMISLIDRFGADIETSVVDDQQFRAIVRVFPSHTFFSWIFQFHGGIRIVGPENVKKEYDEMLRNVLARQTSQ